MMPEPKLDIVFCALHERFPVTPIRKVLLVNPPALPVEEFDIEAARKKRYSAFPPYGLLVIASALREAGFGVSVLDLNYLVLERVQNNTLSDFSETWKVLLHNAIDEEKPDVIGVSCMFTMTHSIFVRVAQEAKRYAKKPLVVGGVHVTNDTERVLREIETADAACTHEADVSFTKLLEFLNDPEHGHKTVRQVAIIVEGEYKAITAMYSPKPEEFSAIPAFNLIKTESYSNVGSLGSFVSLLPAGTKISTVLFNRGCRAQCTFCSVRYFNGAGVRSRNVQSVGDEFQLLHEKYGIGHIMWLDDDLFYGQSVELFNEIARRNLKMTWDASNGVIAAAMTPEIIAAASESGCVGLFFGFESGNPKMLREMKKPGTVEQYRRAAEMMKSYPHIFTRAFLMIGFPHETFKMMMETMQFAIDTNLDWYNITILQPLPSTPIYKSMLEEGLLEDQKTGDVKFQVGPFGKQTEIERQERVRARSFREVFAKLDPKRLPTKEELNHIWFYMNYRVNYERVKTVSDSIKVTMLRLFLRDIADRVTQEHAFANFSAAVIEVKAGYRREALRRLDIVETILAESAYWRDKFEALNLYQELTDLRKNVADHLS